MSCRHTLSPADHGIDECTTCGVLIPGGAPPDLPACVRDGCTDVGLFIVGFEVLCVRHADPTPLQTRAVA